GQPARARRILVPVRGGRYAQLAARVGIGLAKADGASVTLLHVADREHRTSLYQLLGDHAYDDRVERLVTRSGDPVKVIKEELAVIDSRSTDRTREIAADEGVPVFVHEEILPETGTYQGKGEALWKSLHVLTGDIVAWVDTDVTSAHPKFVYGLLGPLLMRPDLQFVKAFYQRPLHIGDELQATGGGRVTELAARPILNLFFPELSGIVQPLSGEQAGRRALLEQLPFFSGYGVETGLLVDTLQRAGLSAIGQVDMT